MKLGNKLEVVQSQTLSANQVQSLNILAYTNQELDEFLTNEYLENPILDCVSNKEEEMLTNVEQLYEKGISYKDHYMEWEEEEIQRKNDIAAKPADELKSMLLMQMDKKKYTAGEWKLIQYLTECLDEDGFFPYEPQEIADASGFGVESVNACLRELKNLEPAGVFSRDIGECLLKQIEAEGLDDGNLSAIIRDYMPESMKGHIGEVSRKLKLTTAEVKKYIHVIGGLNPRPLMNVQRESPEYIIPDVIITRQHNQWEIQLNDGWMGEYRYNDYYIRMMREAEDPELAAYFKEKLERARFIVNCVEQRRSTIIRIVEAILELQKDYFENRGQLQPMSMSEVAKKVDMHVSTVSRAVKGKYLQYRNVVLMKDLFTGAVGTKEGTGEMSADGVKNRIAQLIGKEKSEETLSDSRIAAILKAEGTDISRRTVAKYRAELGILDSRQRAYVN